MTKIKSGIKVLAAATISNLGCGTNFSALALNELQDEVIVKQNSSSGISNFEVIGDKKQLSRKLEENIAGLAALKTWEYLRDNQLIDSTIGLSLTLRKKIPLESGLGSNAASAVAGAMAINEFFSRPLEKKALLPFILAAKQVLSPNTSLINIITALHGGWMLLREEQSLDYYRLPYLKGIYIAIIIPSKLAYSKELVFNERPLNFKIAQQQAANSASLILGLYNSNFDLIKSALRDIVSNQIFAKNIPYYKELQKIVLETGALAANITGTGPSFFAFCNNSFKAEECLEKMAAFYTQEKISYKTLISTINIEGATIS